MRLATVRTPDGTTAVVLSEGGGSPIGGFDDVGAVLAAGEIGIAAMRAAVDAPATVVVEEADLCRPVLSPGAIVCVGLNYKAHILEMGRGLPEYPALFSKLPRTLTDPFAEITIPAVSHKFDYEGELAAVIGKPGRNISRSEAPAHIAGYTVVNDVTARDFQRRSVQWFAGKAFQASTPVGPCLVTPDEAGDVTEAELRVTVNGEERQRAAIEDLVFDLSALIADLSTIVELSPGDMIVTGTPGGVGEASERFLADGDVVEVTIDGVGTIRNTFRGQS